MSAERVSAIIERELGRPMEDIFSSINLETPLGSASIAQVQTQSAAPCVQITAGPAAAEKVPVSMVCVLSLLLGIYALVH